MSASHVFPDPDGRCRVARIVDGPEPPGGWDGVPVTPEECQAVMGCPAMFRIHEGQLSCPQDDRRAWLEMLALQPREDVESEWQRFRDRRGVVKTDVPMAFSAPSPLSSGGIDFPGLPWSPPEVPGLVVRELKLNDLNALADGMIRRGWEPARCPSPIPCCQPPEAHTWLKFARQVHRPNIWQFAVDWRGQPIQFELMEQGPPPISIGTYHLTRQRPQWFWREAWWPIAHGLQQLGFTTCQGLIHADLREWADALKENYAGTLIGPRPGGGWILEYNLAAIPFSGWARRILGPTWQWRTGSVLVREATEAEVGTLPGELERLWGAGHPALPRQLRLLEEQYHLDRGTVLLAFDNGTLMDARIYRKRRATMANHSQLARLRDMETDAAQRIAQWGFYEWLVEAGYQTESSFVTDEIYDHPIAQKSFAFRGVRAYRRHTRFRIPMVEYRVDLAPSLRVIRESQGRWRSEALLPGRAETLLPEVILL